MRASANLSVKGTKYYKAAELFQLGLLSLGAAVRLERQPNNPHDKNAVAVRFKRSGAMLGHVSKELAPKYSALIDGGKIIEVSIANAEKSGAYINIDIRVVYEQSEEQLVEKHNSRLWLSASPMPPEAGVYAIRNIDSGRQYIGSSINLKERIRSHIRDLSLGCHVNHALQFDFTNFGADHFEVTLLERAVSSLNLAAMEENRIKSLLQSGVALYNLTENGQGTGHNSRGYKNSEPVSDRLARDRAEAQQRQIDEIFAKKRKVVTDAFDIKLATLLPKINLLVYFVATFVGALVVLIVVAPKISGESYFIFSAILALAISLLISSHFHEKAKNSTGYQRLVRQRNEQLSKIDDESKTMRGR